MTVDHCYSAVKYVSFIKIILFHIVLICLSLSKCDTWFSGFMVNGISQLGYNYVYTDGSSGIRVWSVIHFARCWFHAFSKVRVVVSKVWLPTLEPPLQLL